MVKHILRRAVFRSAMICGVVLSAQTAQALTVPAAISYEYFGLNFQGNERTSNTFGTLNYTGGAGCGGVCTATTVVGRDPSETINVDEVAYEASGGGYVQAELEYYFVPSASGTIYLHAGDTLTSERGSSSQAYLAIGLAGPSDTAFNNFTSYDTSAYIYYDTDCDGGCSAGTAGAGHPAPLATDQALQVVGGQLYTVYETVYVSPATTGVQLFAQADPTFTAGPGITLSFSPGVLSAVPEPSAWALMLVGFGATGRALRAARRRDVVAA
jgi:hypothetical protein